MRLFNLGFPKSGTSSLTDLLDASNILSSHWEVNKKESGDAKKKKFVGNAIYSNYFNNKKVFEGFKDTQAITQPDVCLPQQGLNYWPQFDPNILHCIRRDYPECKLILLKRNPKKIINSIKKWNDMYFRFVVSEIPGLPSWKGLEDDEILLWIINHFNSIEERYKNDNLFLTIDLEDKTSFHKFCEFMDINIEDIPYQNWPVKNSSAIKTEYSAENYWLVKDLVNSMKSENKSKEMITGMNYKLKTLEDNLKDYENKTNFLKVESKNKNKEIEDLKKNSNELEEIVEKRNSRIADLKININQLTEEIDNKNKKIENLIGDLENKNKEIEDHKQNSDKLMEEIDNKNKEIDDYKKNSNQLIEEIDNKNKKIENLIGDLENKNKEIEDHKQNSDKLMEEIDNKNKEIDDYKKNSNQLIEEIENKNKKIENFIEDLENKIKEIEDIKKNSNELKEVVEKYENKISVLSDELKLDKLQISFLQKEMEERLSVANDNEEILGEYTMQLERSKILLNELFYSSSGRKISEIRDINSLTDYSIQNEKLNFLPILKKIFRNIYYKRK